MMGISVFVTKDFAQLSEVAAAIAVRKTIGILKKKDEAVLGLATGNSPTGLYKHFARAANEGKLDAGRIRSFNLDEYVGLPGERSEERRVGKECHVVCRSRWSPYH